MPKYFFFAISIGRSYLPYLIFSSILLVAACKQSESGSASLNSDLSNSISFFEKNLIDSDRDRFYATSDYDFPPNSLRLLPLLHGQNAVVITIGNQSGNYPSRTYLPRECELFECY